MQPFSPCPSPNNPNLRLLTAAAAAKGQSEPKAKSKQDRLRDLVTRTRSDSMGTATLAPSLERRHSLDAGNCWQMTERGKFTGCRRRALRWQICKIESSCKLDTYPCLCNYPLAVWHFNTNSN